MKVIFTFVNGSCKLPQILVLTLIKICNFMFICYILHCSSYSYVDYTYCTNSTVISPLLGVLVMNVINVVY